jgi:ATP-binding cassette, subfamily B, bacterial PglK
MSESLEIRQTKELLSYLTSRRKKQLVLMIILMIIGSLAEVASIGLVIPFLGALTSPEALYQSQFFSPVVLFFEIDSPEQLLFPFTLMFIFTVVFAGAVRLILLYSLIRFSNVIGHDLGVSMYRRTLYQSYSVHSIQNSSEIINGIIIKANTVTGGVIKPLLLILSSIFLIVGIVIALLFVDVYTSLSALLGFALLYFLVIKLTHKKLRRNSGDIANYSTQQIKSLQEGLGGIRDVIIDGSQDFFTKIYKNSDLSLREALANNQFIAASPRYIMEALGMVLIALLAYSLRIGNSSFESVIPTLGALALGAQRLLPTMQILYDAYSSLKGAQASLTDVLRILSQKLPIFADSPKKEMMSFESEIELKNLSFQYSIETPLIFKNINLKIAKGSCVGFIGETGCGKSTLLDILMGLLYSTDGKMIIDNTELDESNRRSWQSNIAHVPQHVYLSDNSIIDNIAFGVPKEEINYEKIKLSAQKAQISEIIEGLRDGYQTFIGEQGIKLSGGQRQRLGIARAFYRDANVLIFDEATSALDNSTEKAVMDSISSLGKDLTVLIIAHRLTTLKQCDYVVEIMGKSKLVIKTPEEVIKGEKNDIF